MAERALNFQYFSHNVSTIAAILVGAIAYQQGFPWTGIIIFALITSVLVVFAHVAAFPSLFSAEMQFGFNNSLVPMAVIAFGVVYWGTSVNKCSTPLGLILTLAALWMLPWIGWLLAGKFAIQTRLRLNRPPFPPPTGFVPPILGLIIAFFFIGSYVLVNPNYILWVVQDDAIVSGNIKRTALEMGLPSGEWGQPRTQGTGGK